MAATAEKIGWVRDAAGDRMDDIEINIYPSVSPIVVTERPWPEVESLAQRLQNSTGFAITPEELLDSPHIFIGSIEGLIEKFLRLREELGISSVMIGEVGELTPIIGCMSGS